MGHDAFELPNSAQDVIPHQSSSPDSSSIDPLALHSCEHCRKIVLDFREKKSWLEFDAADFSDAAEKGCLLCKRLLKNVLVNTQLPPESKILVENLSQYPDILDIYVGRTAGSEKYHLESFRIASRSDNIVAKYINLRPVNIVPSSDESFHKVQGWYKECQTHEECRRPFRSRDMPTRLIEISYPEGGRVLRLREEHPPSGEDYVALSYCWGGNQECCTTTLTLEWHMTSIDFEKLPNSLKDAVIVTERLGLNLLWIDSLCIVQDDPVDKAWEISCMPLIYSQAAVTILASRATSVHDGFLKARSPNYHSSFELPYVGEGGEIGCVVLGPRTNRRPIEPLSYRAWALQEKLLSRRILEYGTLQTRWMCQENKTDKSDKYIDGWESSLDIVEEEPYEDIAHLDSTLYKEGTDWQGVLDIYVSIWHRIVGQYTKRKLTLPTDRLPAISGIAERFAVLLRDHYIAGLWESQLPIELLWTVDYECVSTRPFRYYQGPSWSWVSVNGFIHMPEAWVQINKRHISVEVLACKTESLHKGVSSITGFNSTSYGAVRGELVLRGKVRQVGLTCGWWSRKLFLQQEDNYLPADVRLDAIEKEFSQEDTWSIAVSLIQISIISGFDAPTRPIGLVLRQISDSEYSQLGVFSFDDSAEEEIENYKASLKWLTDCEDQTITIV